MYKHCMGKTARQTRSGDSRERQWWWEVFESLSTLIQKKNYSDTRGILAITVDRCFSGVSEGMWMGLYMRWRGSCGDAF